MTIRVGMRLASYEILSPLGKGGMGEVYLAKDTKLDRTVALKILAADDASDPQRMVRFVREARAASSLTHPNVAHIYEIGEADGVHFIAMEHVQGDTLEVKLRDGPLDTAEIIDIGIQVADALDEAHRKNITHRDIKPGNIMITARGQVKVLDFGLAKLSRPGEQILSSTAETEAKTDPGLILGTVQYMSPEQALGREVDVRSDIFSLGAVLYQMATARLPFYGATITETIDRITHAQPEAIARFNYDAPQELERIVRKCLEKDRERRYQSARELLVDLRNLKRDSDSEVAAQKLPSRSRTNVKFLVFAAIAVVGILALIGVALYFQKGAGEAIDSIAVLPFANASADPNTEYLSDGITENIINSLSQIPKLRVVPRSSVFRYKGREADPQKIRGDLKVRAVLTGRVVQRGEALNIQTELIDAANDSQLWGEQYNRKLGDILAVQEDIARRISEKLRIRLTGPEQKRLTKRPTENTEAYQLYLKGQYYWNKRTEEGLKKGIEYFNQAIEKDPSYESAYAGLADSYNALGGLGYLAPKDAFPKAREAAHASLAWVSMSDWDWSGAEREFKRSIELNPNYPTAHYWYSYYLAAMGRPDEAMAEAKRALELDPLSLITNWSLGQIFHFNRQYDKAIEQYRNTLELDPNFPMAHWRLALAYEQKSRFEEAIAELQKSISSGGATTTYVADLGHIYAVSGKRGEALKVLNELKELEKKRYVSSYAIARIYIGLGEKDLAFKWLEKAYDERCPILAGLRVDPRLDSLRSDPRFQDLMRRLGLPP